MESLTKFLLTSTEVPLRLTQIPDEKTLMRRLNFTDEMYEFIQNDEFVEKQTPCMESFYAIGQNYKLAHGYIALIVCLFGTFANIFNLLILTRKEMRTPINRMLTALAFVDVLVMIEYVPFALRMYILDPENGIHFTREWALFVLFHSHFTQILHTISIQLTLTMAIWRFVVIKFPSKSPIYCTFKRCYGAIGASFILPIFICIPNYLTFSIYHRHKFYFQLPFGAIFTKEADKAQTLKWFCLLLEDDGMEDCIDAIRERDKYYVDLSDLAKANNGLLHAIHFWTFSVVVKLFPCFILTFFMGYLVKTLVKAKKRHLKLLQGNATSATRPSNKIVIEGPSVVVADGDGLKSNVVRGPISPGNLSPVGSLGPPTPTNNSHDDKPEGEKGSFKGFLPGFFKSSQIGVCGRSKNSRRSDRTSKMLLAVLALFLITEFPQGIMAFLSGLYGQEFFRKCYNSFAEVWDILALINASINFILYCSMSKQFRTQFRNVFTVRNCIKPEAKWTQVPLCTHKRTHESTTVL